MVPALLALAALFGLLFFARLGAARRRELMQHWPAFLLAGAAIYSFARGAVGLGLGLAAAAALAWSLRPRLSNSPPRPAAERSDDPADAAARAVLGVGPNSTAAEIRSAYRAKMAHAHPDRGGRHEEAARLTAARDRLLRKR